MNDLRIYWRYVLALSLCLIALTSAENVSAQDEPAFPPADIVNEEGGPVAVRGVVTYTNAFFTTGVAAPMVILEDQAGFIDRNENFLMPIESQTLGQITSDFYTSPFSYTVALPIEPQATLRDVDNDDEEDTGVIVYAVAYWTNTFGDPFLEERDLYGGGWSTAYASTRVSDDVSTKREIIGGKFLVYAPDDQQGFPNGFGEDGLLFTEDDPIVGLPQGYTIVDMDTDPFTFDRSAEPTIDLIEPEGAAMADYSALSYSEAFDAMIEKMRKEYAFTEYKNIDWDAKVEEFRPRFVEAEENNDALAYRRALRDFAWSIPDGHINGPFIIEDFQFATSGGIGIAVRELDDGRTIVNFVLEESPAADAGMELGTEIIAINGVPITEAISNTVAWSAPFGTEHFKRLQQMRYVTRFTAGEEVEVTFQKPGEEEETVTMEAIPERESFTFSSFNVGLTGFELPVEYRLLDSGYGYVKIYGFADNNLLSIQLWERMMRTLNQNGVPGLIIDMRQNGGGSGFLADQMAAYFFNEPFELGDTGRYNEELDDFYFDERGTERFYLPAEDLRYNGEVTVLIGPNCNSACEFFTYDMTIDDRAAIVGQYPTAGLGGSIDDFMMPENERFRFTVGRAVDMNGDIHIEGKGVPPTVDVPVNEETLFSDGDPILEAAIAYLDGETNVEISDAGAIAIGETITNVIASAERVQYTLEVSEGDVISIYLGDEAGELDTILSILDTAGNTLLANDDADVADGEEATVNSAIVDLEIPADLTLILEVATQGDDGEGTYTLRVEEGSAEE
ncbi:MAG: PDZ domain-containing protein [Caldilineaceae bacterium]|nr:PDZ domain-containing protein [Caldilineaceae bacterium]